MHKTKAAFLSQVNEEYAYAEKKHPGWPSDAIHASAILNEEAGKLTQACIDARYHNDGLSPENPKARMLRYAARVAAMALRFAEGLDQ